MVISEDEHLTLGASRQLLITEVVDPRLSEERVQALRIEAISDGEFQGFSVKDLQALQQAVDALPRSSSIS